MEGCYQLVLQSRRACKASALFASRSHLAGRLKTSIGRRLTRQERAKKPETRRKSPEPSMFERSLQARGRRFDPGWLHSGKSKPGKVL
jgi:hypothetical protein